MSDLHGRFVWYELMTTDPGAAKAFYGEVVGWGTQDVWTSSLRVEGCDQNIMLPRA